LHCLYASADNICSQCEDNYMPNGPEISKCVPDPGVRRCLYAEDNPVRCIACEPGFYLEDGNCYALSFGALIKIGWMFFLFVTLMSWQ